MGGLWLRLPTSLPNLLGIMITHLDLSQNSDLAMNCWTKWWSVFVFATFASCFWNGIQPETNTMTIFNVSSIERNVRLGSQTSSLHVATLEKWTLLIRGLTYFWANYNFLTVLPKPGIMVNKGNHPKMAASFRWVIIICSDNCYCQPCLGWYAPVTCDMWLSMFDRFTMLHSHCKWRITGIFGRSPGSPETQSQKSAKAIERCLKITGITGLSSRNCCFQPKKKTSSPIMPWVCHVFSLWTWPYSLGHPVSVSAPLAL